MPNHTSLASLFTDIANAIRNKTGGSASIVADDFPSAIASIPSGGGSSPVLISKTFTQNGTYTAASYGADGFSSVTVNVSGGGGGGSWTVTNIPSPVTGDDNFIAFSGAGISGTIGAFILYSTATRTPQANRVVAICMDSTNAKISFFDSSGSTFMTSSGVTALMSSGDIIIDITNTGMMIADSNYGLIVVHGGTGTLAFTDADTTPGSSQTQATFTNLSAAPKLYMCALYQSTSYDNSHRVQSVVYADNELLCATNFYTNNATYYGSGFTSTMSGTSLTIASNGQNAGGWFHSGLYRLYYLTAADLEGSA